MPAQKWIIEPSKPFQRITLPPDKLPDEFETYNELSLVAIVKQLSYLSLISDKLFEELTNDFMKLFERTKNLNKRVNQLSTLSSKLNAKSVKIPVSDIATCRSIKKHFEINQIIDKKLFTESSRPLHITHRLNVINYLDLKEKNKPTKPIELPEPIYTGIPINLIKKKKINLLDIETQQPNNLVNIKLPRDDIVRQANAPLCKSMVQLHSGYKLDHSSSTYENFGISELYSNKSIIKKHFNYKDDLKHSKSISVIHNKSHLNQSESIHYCCTNINTGLTEMIDTTKNKFDRQETSKGNSIAFENKYSSSTNSEDTIFNDLEQGNTKDEYIYMLPSLNEQTEALSSEYPSNVVAINTDQVQFIRMSSFRKSLIHSDFCIKRKKLKSNNKESKLKRRNTFCESICHQNYCNFVHCKNDKNCKSTVEIKKTCDCNNLKTTEKNNERRKSTGSINLIDSCCQTEISLVSETDAEKSIKKPFKRYVSYNSSLRKSIVEDKSLDDIELKKIVELKNEKKINKEDENSSSGNWSTESSSSNSNYIKNNLVSTKLNIMNQDNKSIDCSNFSLEKSKDNFIKTNCNLITNNNEKVNLRQRSDQIVFANRDSESWLQYLESNESTETITNENFEKNKVQVSNQLDLKQKNKNSNKNCKRIGANLQNENEDELLSIHSEDTDGYYTSMHTDSGLIRDRPLTVLNSTFISSDKNETNFLRNNSFKNNSLNLINNKSTQVKEINKIERSTKRPSPPLRSCSVISTTSTLNSIDSNFSLNLQKEKLELDNSSVSLLSNKIIKNKSSFDCLESNKSEILKSTFKDENYQKESFNSLNKGWCSSSINSEIDLTKLKNKTTIDSTTYPSMVACPDSDLSSISSFDNSGFPFSNNNRLTVIEKKLNSNKIKHNSNKTLKKENSNSSLESKISKKSSTFGSLASLTKLKELLKPLKLSFSGQKNKENNFKKPSKDDNYLVTKNKKSIFTRFGSINRGNLGFNNKVSQENFKNLKEQFKEFRQLVKNENETTNLKNSINFWSTKKQDKTINCSNFENKLNENKNLEENKNDYYAKLSEQSKNILRNSIEYNNDLKRFSISSNTTTYSGTISSLSNNIITSEQKVLNNDFSQNGTNVSTTECYNKENNENSVAFTKFFPVSRYTAKNEIIDDDVFLVPAVPQDERLINRRHSLNSDYGSNLLSSSNNSNFYCTVAPNRPTTLSLSASLSSQFTSYLPNNQDLNIHNFNNSQNVLNNSINSMNFNKDAYMNYIYSNEPRQNLIQKSFIIPNENISLPINFRTSSAQSYDPVYNNTNLIIHPQQSLMFNHHQSISSSSSPSHHLYQPSTSSSYNYYSSATSSNINTPSPLTSSNPSTNQSPFHQQTSTNNLIKSSPFNENKTIAGGSRNLITNSIITSTNTAIVSPFFTENKQEANKKDFEKNVSTNIFKNNENKKNVDCFDDNLSLNEKFSCSPSNENSKKNFNSNINFRDSMRLSKNQKDKILIKQKRASWAPSSSNSISSPSGSLGSSTNSSSENSPCNDINKLIKELSNFDVTNFQENEKNYKTELSYNQLDEKQNPIYGVNIPRTKFTSNKKIPDVNSINTNIYDFKQLINKANEESKDQVKISATEQLKVIRKPLIALNDLNTVNEKISQNNLKEDNLYKDYYCKETYDNVTDEELESKKDFKNNTTNYTNHLNSSNNFSQNNFRTRVINGRIYKTPYRLEKMYPPIEEANCEDDCIVTNNQHNTSTWV